MGVLAFVGSILLGIYSFGLRDKFSNESTASAYSVFNKDGQAIVGGFTGEQLDRQLRGGFARNTAKVTDGSVATALSSSSVTKEKVAEDERVRRRRAAAAAAERRTSEHNVA